MVRFHLRCFSCGRTLGADLNQLKCVDCGGPLLVEYEDDEGESSVHRLDGTALDVPLPLRLPGSRMTLGEGDTPLVELPSVAQGLGVRDLWAKLEMSNPTGSFKDRGTVVMMSAALEHGVSEVVEDSSGNAGASVAAYAARAGIKAHVFAPSSAPSAKLNQIRVYGAEAHLIEGSREDVTAAAVKFHADNGLTYLSHSRSPYFIEGTKTFAYEVLSQLADQVPDHLVIPVGNGSLLLGAFKGFRELQDRGFLDTMPKLHCVQAEAVMPIAAAFEGRPWSDADLGGTVAGGIAVGAPPRLEQVLDAVRSTGGAATAVSEEDILRWQKTLAEREGIYAEATSSAAFAGVEKLVGGRAISSEVSVLVPITGFGLKDGPMGG